MILLANEGEDSTKASNTAYAHPVPAHFVIRCLGDYEIKRRHPEMVSFAQAQALAWEVGEVLLGWRHIHTPEEIVDAVGDVDVVELPQSLGHDEASRVSARVTHVSAAEQRQTRRVTQRQTQHK